MKEFQSKIKDKFPVLEEQKGEKIAFSQKSMKREEIVAWRFLNKARTHILLLEQNALVVEYLKYEDFDEYKSDVLSALTALFEVFPEIVSTRLGLRYIDQVKIDNNELFNWDEYINPHLCAAFQFIPDKQNLTRQMGQIELAYDEYRIRFQYGIANSVFPAPIIKKEFVLDYDCFTHESFSDATEVLTKLELFSKAVLDIFEMSIGDKLRKLMGGLEKS